MKKKTDDRPVFVIGHKNPDTDSVCAAIAYAELKREITGGNYIAARCGHLNEETQYVLKRFGVQAPVYITDVRSQVRDMEMHTVFADSGLLSLKKAASLMHEAEVVTLCITNNGKLSGLVTSDDIVRAYMDVYDDGILSKAGTPYSNIIETLEGELITGDSSAAMDRGKVVIAAGNPETLEDSIEPGDFVILGNRYDTQLCAIEMNAGCIIVCEGAKVSESITRLAGEKGTAIIVTPHNTFTAARLIHQSLPVKAIMKREGLISFRMDEHIEEIESTIVKLRHRYFPVLDKRDNYVGMISRRNFLGVKKKQLILVDHNEKGQAVNGMEDAEILEIIDHHRLGTVNTLAPVFFRNQPLGSSSTIIWQMYNENGVKIRPEIAGLMLSAILSDTLMYKSPTCTEIDRVAGEELAKIAGVDYISFAREMFRAGANLEKKTADEIIRQDFKRFSVGEKTIGIGQINAMDTEELRNIREKVLPEFEKMREKTGLDMIFFLLTDIIGENSEVLFDGKEAEWIVENAFPCIPEDERSAMLPGIVSRKKQFLPAVLEVMQG
ncbi:MAG: putative manganese-dependent inorganic diphosphatase [Lachnospiraceae bacterium]|nr:putative manganese-dependent inorganic diphosphatase [Lachnospiraceae bacterium]